MHNNSQILTSDSQTLENDRFDDDCEFTIEELTARAYPQKADDRPGHRRCKIKILSGTSDRGYT